MHRGYIKVWRRILDSEMIKNHKLWTFWTWCLLKASHKDITITVGFQDVELKAGQFIFGRKRAASELNMSEREIRTCLKHLIFSEKVTTETTNKYSIISIINWSIYQPADQQTDQQIDQRVTSKRPASDHKQECKEHKNVKKKEEYKNIYMSGSDQKNGHFQKFISFFNDMIGTKYRVTKKTESQFKSRLEEGFTIQDIEKAVANAKTDAFLMGKNDRKTRYLTPEFILRADKLDKWINHIPIQADDNRISESGKQLLETMKRMEERGAFN